MSADPDRAEAVRVLVVINRVGAQGGAERSTQEIIEGLHGSRAHFSVFALWPDSNPSAAAQLSDAGVQIRVGPKGFLRRVRALRQMIREVRPDVVHSVLFDADMAARAATACTRTPNLCSLVSTQYSAEAMAAARSRWKLQVVRLLDALTGRLFVSRFHAVSAAVRDHANARMSIPTSRVAVVERGRDLTRLGDRSPERGTRVREALGVGTHTLVLLTLGRQEPAKDHATMVRAVAAVAESVSDVVLLVAGSEGSSTAEVSGLVQRLGVPSLVRHLGVRTDVGDLLSAADVFVLTSRWEGLPGAAIEALALGTPIVSTDIPATRDVVGENGLLVPVGDHDGVARAIVEVASSPDEARRRAECGMQDFHRRFTAAAMLDGMAQLYASVARPRR